MEEHADNACPTAYMTLHARYIIGTRLGACGRTTERIWLGESIGSMPALPSLPQCCLLHLRSCVFDNFLDKALDGPGNPVVINLGCGLDYRQERCHAEGCTWYDVDLGKIMGIRRRYLPDAGCGKMISADIADTSWISGIEGGKSAIVIAEGVLMYLGNDDVHRLFSALSDRFDNIRMVFDAYTEFGKRLAAAACPQLGIRSGINDVRAYESGKLAFSRELDIRKDSGMKKMPAQIRLAAGLTFFRPERIVFKILEYVK